MGRRKKRYGRYKKRREKRRAVLYVLASGLFIYSMIRWGVPGVINLISWWNADEEVVEQEYQIPPQKPQIGAVAEATFSAKVDVEGRALMSERVELSVNGGVRDEMEVDDGGSFVFEGVSLESGENDIKVVGINEIGRSQASSLMVIRDETAPEITIDKPGLESEQFGPEANEVTIVGQVDEEAKVFINDHLVLVDSDGEFEFLSNLEDGLNEFVVKAVDMAGNESQKLVRVNYSR